jgi:hypothetical protein
MLPKPIVTRSTGELSLWARIRALLQGYLPLDVHIDEQTYSEMDTSSRGWWTRVLGQILYLANSSRR